MSAKLVTFDVYMALIDIQGSLSPVVAECLAIPIDKAGKIVRAWRAKQMERAAASNSLAGERTSFRDCTRMGLDYVLGRNGYDLPGADRECLVAAWDGISPWPEARDVVAEVKERGFETAILSNGDQDMLDALAQGFGDDLDHVLSSETAGAYKPDPSVYELPTRLLNVEKANVLHVAASANDGLGAVAFGMECYWSNRAGDIVLDPRFPPDHQGRDLLGVLDVLQTA
jgi:2-haloacid dehalogenase